MYLYSNRVYFAGGCYRDDHIKINTSTSNQYSYVKYTYVLITNRFIIYFI